MYRRERDGFLGIAVPVHDVVIAHEADDGASTVQFVVTPPAQHRDAFVVHWDGNAKETVQPYARRYIKLIDPAPKGPPS